MKALCFVALVLAVLTDLRAAEKTKSDILAMLAVDLRCADLGCQGSPDVNTPNIDSLAANGVRCTAGYVTAPQCLPSRAGLMSGAKTIADHLKAAGHVTGHFGKWHLGLHDKASAPKEMDAKGDWKLVRGKAQRDWHLIHLSHDVKEDVDLTSQHPDKARELRTRLEKWASALPPAGASFKDPTAGDDDDAQTKKK